MHRKPSLVQKLAKLTPPVAIAAALLLGGCRREEASAGPDTTNTQASAIETQEGQLTVHAGQGRDRLCLAEEGGRASFITYAEGSSANCMVRGRWSPGGPQAITPDGDASCTIPFNRDDRSVTLLGGGPGCAYYCGPGASFTGKSFVRMDKPEPVSDLGGDPLC